MSHSEVFRTETSFFRDFDFFEALRYEVFPQLLRQRRSDRQLEIWSAACSSGQEPYSLALLIQAYFPLLTQWKLQFLASDISEEMLSRSREGCYSQSEVDRKVPPELLKRYFQQQGDRWCISEDLRLMVEFRQLDLLKTWPPLPSMDLILMRNVLIYFDMQTRRTILDKVRRILKPDGYLLLGATETPFSSNRWFESARLHRVMGYRLRRPLTPEGN